MFNTDSIIGASLVCMYILSSTLPHIQDRALDLELTQGDTATLIRSANELLEWVEETLGIDFLHERPPGEMEKLLQNAEGLQVIYVRRIQTKTSHNR